MEEPSVSLNVHLYDYDREPRVSTFDRNENIYIDISERIVLFMGDIDKAKGWAESVLRQIEQMENK